MSAADAVVAGIGVLGLVLHCGAMFFPSLVARLPGSGGVIDEVNALGTVSIIGYVVPAVLVPLGFRRQHRVVLAGVVTGLVIPPWRHNPAVVGR